MTRPTRISTYILTLAVSLLLCPATAMAQRKNIVQAPDSTRLFQGVEVSVDLVGPIMKAVGDYGQIEGALRVNLKDRYFPIIELGYGSCDYTEETTLVSYKTSAPYGKIGIDFNLLKDKHDIYRLYAGARYAYTSYKMDYGTGPLPDPYWGGTAEWGEAGVQCHYHWAEAVVGVQAKIWGPVHLGWSLRYLKRLTYDEGENGKSWYVPGFGKTDKSNLTGTFNVIIVI